jgi:hypothetical protein
VHESGSGRFCCKSLFALLIKTSSPEDKLAGDLGNVIGDTSIGGRRSNRLTAEKLSAGNFGLLQQYRHFPANNYDAPTS